MQFTEQFNHRNQKYNFQLKRKYFFENQNVYSVA